MSNSDLSDEAMAARFGDILFEIPELWDAIRVSEMNNRPKCVPGGFEIKSDVVSVERDAGDVLRIQVSLPRR